MKFLKRLLGLGGGEDRGQDDGSFECDACGKEFETEAELRIHEHEHEVETSEETSEPAVDYDELVSHTIKEIKSKVEDMDVDYEKLLEAEKANKDRKTLKQWINKKL
ncbi:MAG: hypothetical protein SV186_06925 [Candidatus Nanohaloarchaea archaeon]|nr:hypothetical protein [Candidatus Nanohaloarchaea archaeon]